MSARQCMQTLLARSALMQHAVRPYQNHARDIGAGLIGEPLCITVLEREDRNRLQRLVRMAELGGIEFGEPKVHAGEASPGHICYAASGGSFIVKPGRTAIPLGRAHSVDERHFRADRDQGLGVEV